MIESHSISSKSTADDVKDNERQYSKNFKLPELNVANIVVQNDLFTGLCVEDGFSASQMCPIDDNDADDNFSMALDSDVSRSSETTSSRESVSSYFFNSPQNEEEDAAKQFEIGMPYDP